MSAPLPNASRLRGRPPAPPWRPYDRAAEAAYPDVPSLMAAAAAAEWDLCGAVLADPARLCPAAWSAGVRPGRFTQDDLRLVWCAADVCRGRGRAVVLRVAERALRAGRYWWMWSGPNVGAGRSLAELAGGFFPSRQLTLAYARRCGRLWDRAERVADLWAEYRDVLAGRWRPAELAAAIKAG